MKKTKVVVAKKKSQGDKVKESKNPKEIFKMRANKIVTGSSRSKTRLA